MLLYAPALAVALLCAFRALPGVDASLHCAMRREISPCTCQRQDIDSKVIIVTCQRINTYKEIAQALRNKFNPMTKIELEISYSQLPDIGSHSIRELGLSISKLKLNNDSLSDLPEHVFTRLDRVEYFALADNALTEMPRQVMRHVPHVKTLDLCRNNIATLTQEDFRVIPKVEHLLLTSNLITKIEKHTFPRGMKHIHLGFNNLSDLNGALRDLDNLEWVFINDNKFKNIDNELPVTATKLTFMHAARNQLETLPKDIRQIPSLESVFFYDNCLKSLDRVWQKSVNLLEINLSVNQIEELAEDEFTEAIKLAQLDMAYNKLRSLNGSLRSLKSLTYLNLTHNQFTEFSFQEIKGLKKLSVIDLSHNHIEYLTGSMENLVDAETRVLELRLDHNKLHSMGGALMGLHGLLRLNLSHNFIQQISPDDLIGMDELKLLDISFNQITTLEETSKTFLPALEELLVHHNNITALDKDFHGLPSLCIADLSYNQIHSINYDLVSKTRCTINGARSKMKIYLQDNPVLCDNVYELLNIFESFNARISGDSACMSTQTVAPSLMRALNDIVPQMEGAPSIVVAHVYDGEPDIRPFGQMPPLSYRRVGALIGHVLPERESGLPVIVEPPVTLPPATSNVVVKWPDEQRAPDRKPTHPLPDQLRLRSMNASPQ